MVSWRCVSALVFRCACVKGPDLSSGPSLFPQRSISLATLNLEAGFPTVDDARRRLVTEMQSARARGVRGLKVIHGWGSSGEGGKLGPAIRKSLRLRVKEGKASFMLPGERFSSDSNEGREFVQRHPTLRNDRDYNRANPGITLVELAL